MSRAERLAFMASSVVVLAFLGLLGFAAWRAGGFLGAVGVACFVAVCALLGIVSYRRAGKQLQAAKTERSAPRPPR